MSRLVFSLTLLLTLANAIAADRLAEALVGEALAQPVNLQFEGTLADALDRIARQTGVSVKLSAEAHAVLPAGQLTTVRGRFENVPLGEVIELIASRLALRVHRGDGFVELTPIPAAIRSGQPLSWKELRVLELLRATSLQLETPRPTYADLARAIDERLLALSKSQDAASTGGATLRLEDRSRDLVAPDRVIALPRNPSLYDALELLAAQTPVTWYPWDGDIVLVPKRDLHQRLLLKRVNLSYAGDDIERLLDQLEQTSGVPFRYEPGVLQRVRPDRRVVNVSASRTTIRSVLEAIQRHTGLAWTVDDDGVLIGDRERIAALLPLSNGLLVPLYDAQLPESLRGQLEQETRAWLERHGAPTTRPAP